MFEGKLGKDMMIKQGYVPTTCSLPDEFAGMLIYSEVCMGRDACAGCNEDRKLCHGRPKKIEPCHTPATQENEAGEREKTSDEA